MHLALFIWKQYLGEIVYLISSRARSNYQGSSLDHGQVRIARANWRRFIWDSFQGQSESNRSDGGSQENSASKCQRRSSYQYSQRNRKSQEVVSLSKHCQVGIMNESHPRHLIFISYSSQLLIILICRLLDVETNDEEDNNMAVFMVFEFMDCDLLHYIYKYFRQGIPIPPIRVKVI